jgi:hypothetical protein
MSRRALALLAMGLLLALALVPFSYPHCPAWQVTVVDQQNRPIPGMTVRLSYINYSLEIESHDADGITDQRGQVTFPARNIHATLLRRCYYTVLSATAGVHASFGPHANVLVFGKGMDGLDVDPKTDTLVYWRGAPSQMYSRIVANRPRE